MVFESQAKREVKSLFSPASMFSMGKAKVKISSCFLNHSQFHQPFGNCCTFKGLKCSLKRFLTVNAPFRRIEGKQLKQLLLAKHFNPLALIKLHFATLQLHSGSYPPFYFFLPLISFPHFAPFSIAQMATYRAFVSQAANVHRRKCK